MTTPVRWWLDLGREQPPDNPLLIVVLDDDPSAVSTLPQGYSHEWQESTAHGRSPTARVASHLGVPIHIAHDDHIPPGHDLLLLADVGRGLTSAAARLACGQFGAEPQLITGRGSGVDDLAWMRKAVDVRDRADPDTVPDAIALAARILHTAADADLPVLIDGAVGAAAAAVCDHRPAMQIPALGDEPAQAFFAERSDLPTWGMSGLGPGAGLAALHGLAVLRLGLLAAHV
jgi:hypothetical protein